MAVLLLFFSFGFISTARADCSTSSVTVSGSLRAINGEYITSTPISSKPAWVNGDTKVRYDTSLGSYTITNTARSFDIIKHSQPTLPLGFYDDDSYPQDPMGVVVASTTCETEPETEPTATYFISEQTPLDLGASVGSISTSIAIDLNSWIIVVSGILIGFWIVQKLITSIPKDKVDRFADREIARSKRDIKEEKRIIATLD